MVATVDLPMPVCALCNSNACRALGRAYGSSEAELEGGGMHRGNLVIMGSPRVQRETPGGNVHGASMGYVTWVGKHLFKRGAKLDSTNNALQHNCWLIRDIGCRHDIASTMRSAILQLLTLAMVHIAHIAHANAEDGPYDYQRYFRALSCPVEGSTTAYVTITLPVVQGRLTNDRFPTVVLLNGFVLKSCVYAPYANALAAKGYAVIQLDDAKILAATFRWVATVATKHVCSHMYRRRTTTWCA